MMGFVLFWASNLVFSFVKKYNKQLSLVFLLILYIIIGYRDFSVGTDTKNYHIMYDSISRVYIGWESEFLFLILNKVAVLFNTFRGVLLISAFLTLLFFYLSIRNFANPLFSIFCLFSLYFVFYSMNIMRQVIAVSIVMYGYTLLNKNHTWKFILCILFAFLFHNTAILGLIALIIRKINLSDSKVFTTVIISIFTGFVGIITKGYIFNIIAGKYAFYIDREMRTTLIVPVFLSFFLSFFFLFIYKTGSKSIKQSLWMKLFLIAVIINNLFVSIRLGTRLVMFFSISEIVLIPLYIQNNIFREKLFPLSIVVIYLGGILFTLLGIKSAEVLPYSNVLFKELFALFQ